MAYVTDTDLAGIGAGQGANMVGTLHTGVGAVRRTAQEEFNDVVRPEQFGAVGDGVADDTDALQAALNTRRSVALRDGGVYLLKRRLEILADPQPAPEKWIKVSGKATIKIASDFELAPAPSPEGPDHVMIAFLVTRANCTFQDVTFDCTLSPIGPGRNSACLWVMGAGFKAIGCTFIKHPKGAAILAKQFGTWLLVQACHFDKCSGAIFTQARSCVLTGNSIIDCTDAAIALNGRDCKGVTVAGNSISNETAGEIPSMIAIEEGASRWSITGNTLLGVRGGGIICFNDAVQDVVQGGVISGNVVTGARFDGFSSPGTQNPVTLLNISQFYEDWIAAENILTMPAEGSSGTRIALISASGGVFSSNIIDGTTVPGGTAVEILSSPNGKGLVYKDNVSRMTAPARHILFGAGDYHHAHISIRGGRFLGGSAGIDSDMRWGEISNFSAEIVDISESTVFPTLCAMSSYFGDRATFLNGDAWVRPHRVGVFTDMYASALPTTAGALPFQNGDTFQYLDPTASGYKGVVRVPGMFKSFGALV